MKPALTFRVKPDPNRTYYFRVEVYRTLRDLQRSPHPARGGTRGFSGMHGICIGYHKVRVNERGKIVRTSPELGTIRFAKSKLGVGVVAHEVFHAVVRFLERLRIQLPDGKGGEWASADEETGCRAQQNMMRQIYERVYAAELVKP